LINGDIAIGKDCREQCLDHEHVKDCYKCARLVLYSTKTFHRANIGATRVLVASDLFTPAREKYFSSTPCSVCEPKVAKGMADCEGCREQNPDHKHTLYCFSCARYVLMTTQKLQGATRVVVAPDTLPLESEKCTGAAPCSTCKRLMTVGKADCKKCRQREYDYSHAKGCFNCLRRYFVVKSLPFHTSIVTAARIVGLPAVPSGLAETLVYPVPDDIVSDKSGENGTLMWDLIDAGDVILGCSSAPTPSDTAVDSETEDDYDEADEASQELSDTAVDSETEDAEVDESSQKPSDTAVDSGMEDDEVDGASQQPKDTAVDSETDDDDDEVDETSQKPTDTTSSRPSPPVSVYNETVAAQQAAEEEEDPTPPSPPTTRSNKRKRRLSRTVSPTPEPRSSASPDPIPRTFQRPTHVPAFRYEPTRSPSPIPIRPGISLPEQNLANNAMPPIIPNLANDLACATIPSLPNVDLDVVRRRREHRAFMERSGRRIFDVAHEGLQSQKETLWRRLRDVEREDEELRRAEVERLRGEIERLERNE
jgi:hypothetical protein